MLQRKDDDKVDNILRTFFFKTTNVKEKKSTMVRKKVAACFALSFSL